MAGKIRNKTELKTIPEFFKAYGLGTPGYPDFMCMKLEDQSASKLSDMPLYRANFFRIIFFKNARLKFSVGDVQFSIPKYCLCFTYPGKLESWSRRGKLHGYVIYFSASFAGIDITSKHFVQKFPFFTSTALPFIRLNGAQTKELEMWTTRMSMELKAAHPDNLEMLKNILIVLLQLIRRWFSTQPNRPETEENEPNRLLYHFKGKIDELIHESEIHKSRKPLSVSSLAKRLNISSGYLNRVIKTTTGKTATYYIHEKIIFEAKSYLRNSDININEIAFILGFDDHSYFSRFFKKYTGYSPLAFRKTIV